MSAGVGSKTPVSILQEYAVRLSWEVSYELVEQQMGTHKNYFKYEAHVSHFTAIGEGNSKQQAKHEAAKNLLLLIGIEEDTEISSNLRGLSVPQDNSVNYNAVGALTEYCLMRNHPEPEFNLIDEFGPPHAKEFTFKCNVSLLSQMARARTKKQARQMSAHNMLMALKVQNGEEPLAVMKIKNTEEPLKDRAFVDGIEEKWAEKTKLAPTYQTPVVTKFKDYFKAHINMSHNSPTLQDLIKKKLEIGAKAFDVWSRYELVKTIANELELKLEEENQSDPNETVQCFLLQLDTPIYPLVGAGATEDEAALDLLKTMTDAMVPASLCSFSV